jgi:putative ABC transport system permease protein
MLENLIAFGNALPNVVTLGLIWGVMAIGLYITFKILELSDLTVDGSFCTGGAVCAVMMWAGYSVWVAMIGAFLAGVVAGSVTGFLHTKCKIPAILAGILTQLSLWPINMTIMGVTNDSSLTESYVALSSRNYDVLVGASFVDKVAQGTLPFYYYPVLTIGLVSAVTIGLLYWFFGTERGCSIRATGANEHMARAQGINTDVNKFLGLMISNGLVALAGSLLTQFNGFAQVSMGSGAIVNGLAAVVIGDVIFGKLFKNFALKLMSVSLGAIIYFGVIQAVLTLLEIDSNYLKLFSAIVVAIFLTVPNLKGNKAKKHHKGEKEAQHA